MVAPDLRKRAAPKFNTPDHTKNRDTAMNPSNNPNQPANKRWIIYLIAAVVFIWGQWTIQLASKSARKNLSAAQAEQQRLESIFTENEGLLQQGKQQRDQLNDCRSDLNTEIRSFKRPAMLAALMQRLEFPENCVYTSTLSGLSDYKRTLVYSSQAGQQLVVRVWRQEKLYDGSDSITAPPTHEFVIDVPPGQAKVLEVGLRDNYTDQPSFDVKFDEEELLKIDLHGLQCNSSGSHGSLPSGLFSPGTVTRNLGGGLDHNKLPSLLKQGYWLDQQKGYFNFFDTKTKAKSSVSAVVHWKTNGPLTVDGDALYRLPQSFRDSVNLNYDRQAGLYRIEPKTKE